MSSAIVSRIHMPLGDQCAAQGSQMPVPPVLNGDRIDTFGNKQAERKTLHCQLDGVGMLHSTCAYVVGVQALQRQRNGEDTESLPRDTAGAGVGVRRACSEATLPTIAQASTTSLASELSLEPCTAMLLNEPPRVSRDSPVASGSWSPLECML